MRIAPSSPLPHELARLLHHGVAGVVVGEHEDLSRLRDDRAQFLASARSKVDRLVADDVEAGLEEKLGRREMLVVGRDDDDEVQPCPRGIPASARAISRVAAVDARRIEEQSAPDARERAGSAENAPATSSAWPSMTAAMRCTAPMKAPRPPPIMPKRSFRFMGLERENPGAGIA